MAKKSQAKTGRLRIPSVVKIILFVVVVSAAAGALYISVIRPGGVLVHEALDGKTAVAADSLPTLVDLGADKCIPCKMMAPMLEQLKQEYEGKLDIIFLDVWKDPTLGRKYGLFAIPTQIFFDENGKELYRHVGYYSNEDILRRWKELGYNFE